MEQNHKNYDEEIENLKQMVESLTKLVMKFTESKNLDSVNAQDNPKNNEDLKNIHPMKNMHPDPKLSIIMENLCKTTDQQNRTGSITYLGVFSSSGRQSNWIQNEINTDDLLTLVENKSASAVLQCIGNNDRLNLLLALLKSPMTVAGMVKNCGFNSTGQVYHHLKPLISADIVYEVEQGERGIYAVKFHRVQGIIMLLAGIADLTDTKYSQGDWNENKESDK